MINIYANKIHLPLLIYCNTYFEIYSYFDIVEIVHHIQHTHILLTSKPLYKKIILK